MNIFRRGSKSTVRPYQPTVSDERLVSDNATQSLLGTPQDDPVIEVERKSWPRIPDSIPPSAWIIASIEMCERFAFFGLSGPLQNFLQKSQNDSLRHGAFGTVNWVFVTGWSVANIAHRSWSSKRHETKSTVCFLVLLYPYRWGSPR